MKVRMIMLKTWETISAPWQKLAKDYEKASGAFFETLQNSPSQLNLVGKSLKTMSRTKAHLDSNMEKFWESFRMVSAGDIERVYERLGEIQDRLDQLSETLEANANAGKTDDHE